MKRILIVTFAICLPFIGICAETNPDSSSFYLKEAQKFKELKRVGEADRHYKKAIDYNLNDIATRIEYGNFLMDNRKYFVAYEQFSLVLQQDNDHLPALQKITEVCFHLHRWQDVIFYANRLVGKNYGEKVHYMLGKAFYEEEDYGEAAKALAIAIKQYPNDLDALTLVGKVYIEISDYRQALIVYQQALKLDENNNKLIYELGLLYSTLNNEKEAVKYMELAAEKGYKKDLDYRQNLGFAYLDVDLKKGEEILATVLQKKPQDAEVLTQIAQANYKQKNFQIAADTYYKVYENDPTNTRALYMTGIAYMKKGDKVLGTSICEKAITLDPALGELKKLKMENF